MLLYVIWQVSEFEGKVKNFYVLYIAGYELATNERTCVVPEAFLLFARKENIGRISIENGNNDAIIPVTGVKDARYIIEFLEIINMKWQLLALTAWFVSSWSSHLS